MCHWTGSHSPQVRMQSSNHRLRDMEQHHPLLSAGSDVETGSLAGGVIVGVPHSGHTAANRTLWFIQDSCGMVCAGMTWFLVLYAEFVVNFVMLLPSKSFWYSLLNGAAFNSLAVLALASHLRTMLTDPVRILKEAGERVRERMRKSMNKSEFSFFNEPDWFKAQKRLIFHFLIFW